MKSSKLILGISLCLALLMVSELPVSAQFGLGIGGWGSGWGPFFWAEISPRPARRSKSTATVVNQVPIQGYLQGKVALTAPSCAPLSLEQETSTICLTLKDLTVTAMPNGSNQWYTTRPNLQGDYRLALPPGSYVVQVHHPLRSNILQEPRLVTIQPGKVLFVDIQVSMGSMTK